MKLTLHRKWLTERSTIGELYVNGAFYCFTLEDLLRPPGEKIKHKTAIPAGNYQVAITYSARFGRMMPLLINVPMFEGIRIHAGNTADETSGCILVGRGRPNEGDKITQSREAFDTLFQVLVEAAGREQITIEIKNPPEWDAKFTQNRPRIVSEAKRGTQVSPAPEKRHSESPGLKAGGYTVSIPSGFHSMVPQAQTEASSRIPSGLPLLLARVAPGVARVMPWLSTTLSGIGSLYQQYRWPLWMAAGMIVAFWAGWHCRRPFDYKKGVTL